MKKNMRKDILITGFALFAVFFGSGNLIFPPQVGLLSGQYVPAAMAGLALTGILFPMMAVAAVGNTGYDLKDMMRHVTPWWHYFYMGIGLLAVIFGTIPRCGGVAYESGLEGIFGSMPSYVRIGFLLLFFAVSYYFAMNKSSVIDKIGNYLTPLLLVSLVAVIILAIVHPIDRLGEGEITSGTEAFVNAFLTGYNTGDVGTGIICAGIFIEAFRNKGYTERKEYKKYRATIKHADFVTISIGSNDLLHLIQLDLNMEEMIKRDAHKFDEACVQFAKTFPKIIREIRAVNPDVKIYADNIYNPAKGIDAFSQVYSVADAYINRMNRGFYPSDEYVLVDIKKCFDGEKESMVNLSFKGREIDPHPSEKGHKKIAQMVIKAMER